MSLIPFGPRLKTRTVIHYWSEGRVTGMGLPQKDDEWEERAEPDPALSRWRARLKPPPAKAALTGTPVRERKKSPRTVSEAAEELGLSVHTIRAWVADRRIAHMRLGRAIRIPAAEIRRVIEKSTVPAVRED